MHRSSTCRGASLNTYEGAICSCGSAWFILCDEENSPAGVTLDERGAVTGFAGKPVCKECGQAWAPARDRMRLIK